MSNYDPRRFLPRFEARAEGSTCTDCGKGITRGDQCVYTRKDTIAHFNCDTPATR